MNKNNYFQEFVEIHNNAEYFDPLENKGCSDKEIEIINQLIYPFTIPQIIYKYLKYCGKIYRNSNSFFQSIIDAQKIPENKNFLQEGKYLILEHSLESSVYCGIKVDDLKLENPPYYICESGILKEENFFLNTNFFIGPTRLNELQESLIKEDIYFEENRRIYEIKQIIVETYDTIEKDKNLGNHNDIIVKLRRLCKQTRFITLNRKSYESFIIKLQYEILNNEELFVKTEKMKILKSRLISKIKDLEKSR